jgi:hypothetical protein
VAAAAPQSGEAAIPAAKKGACLVGAAHLIFSGVSQISQNQS